MSEQPQIQKSSMPMVLGIINIVLAIPHYCCAVLCAAAATIAVGANEIGKVVDGKVGSEAAVDAAATTGIILAYLSTGLILAVSVMSFFSKGAKAKQLGMVMIIASIATAVICCIQFSLCGLFAGVLGLIAGVISRRNALIA